MDAGPSQMITASLGRPLCRSSRSSLLNGASRRRWLAHRARSGRFGRVLLRKVAVVPQITVKDAGQFSSLRTEGRPSAFQEEDGHDAAVIGIRIRRKPSEARAAIGTGAGLAQYREFIEVGAQRPRRAVSHRATHATGNVR